MGRITVVQISTTSAEWFPISARPSELLQSSSDFPLVSFLSHAPRQRSKILSFHSVLDSKPSYLIEEIEITRPKLVLQFFFSSAWKSFIKVHNLSGLPLATEEMALFTPKATVLFCRILPLLFSSSLLPPPPCCLHSLKFLFFTCMHTCLFFTFLNSHHISLIPFTDKKFLNKVNNFCVLMQWNIFQQ